MHLGAEFSTNPFSSFAARNHANVFANPLVVLLAVFERRPLCEVVTLTSTFCSLSCPRVGTTVFYISSRAQSLPDAESRSRRWSQFLHKAISVTTASGSWVCQSQPP